MPRHTTIKKRGAKTRAKSGKRVVGTRKRVVGTRKRVSGAEKRKHTTTARKRKGGGRGGFRNPVATVFKSPLTAAGDVAAGRRLVQAIAIRLGFKPETIHQIMGEKRIKGVPTTISNNQEVRNAIKDLGRIGKSKESCPENLDLGDAGDKTSGRNRIATALKGPLTTGQDAAAARRLLQAVAIRLGFEPQTIHKIMGEKRLKPVPTTILKNKGVKDKLGELGQLKGNCIDINDVELNTSDANINFVDFGNTGNVFTRNIGRNRKDKKHAYWLENTRNRGFKLQNVK